MHSLSGVNAGNGPGSSLPKAVFFDHDGGADDLLSLMLLLTMPHIDLLGITVTPADCFAEDAVESTLKLLKLEGKTGVEVGTLYYHGTNAFPAEWRARPKIINALPIMLNVEVPFNLEQLPESEALLASRISASGQPVTILMTGPCSSLVKALQRQPALASNIEEVVWMAGALDVAGNVRMHHHDGSAEWNVFWDPESTARLLALGLPLTLVPLDVTNKVPVNLPFLKKLAKQASYEYASLAGQIWATTIDTIPAVDYTYFMWDVLSTSYLAIPDAFTMETVEIAVEERGRQAGNIYRAPGSGRQVKIASNVQKEVFYQYIHKQFGRNFGAGAPSASIAGKKVV